MERTRFITQTALLFAIVLLVQALGLPQIVTGPLVNACLLLATMFGGVASGIIIGCFTPWIALLRGILSSPLGPMVPFIMAGNGVLVVLFWLLAQRETFSFKVVGIILGALAKYLLLSSAVSFVVSVAPGIARAMQLPQLFTALLGGALTLIVEQVVRRAFKKQ